MSRKHLAIWIIIEAVCVALLLGVVLYKEQQDKKALETMKRPTVTTTMPNPTKYPGNISLKNNDVDNLSDGQEEVQVSPTPTPTEAPVSSIPESTEALVFPTPTEAPVSLAPESSDESQEMQSDTVQDEMPSDTTEQVPEITPIENSKYANYDNKKQEWWFRRNTTHQKSGSGEGFPIAPFDAYYVDEQATDEDKVFYLTFDCGYEMGFTPAILDVLKKYDAPAMFFVTQSFLKSYPDYVKRMKEEGHLVGNHTVRHLSTPSLTPEEIQIELDIVAKTMFELTGYEIDSFFRPPMGEYSERTLQVVKDLGYKSIFWSMAYYDYDTNNQPGKEYVIEHFKDYHHNGCIALLHNTSESNTQALEEVLQLLLEEGYRFASLEELE